MPENITSLPAQSVRPPQSKRRRILRIMAGGLALIGLVGFSAPWSTQLKQTVTSAHSQVLGATSDLTQNLEAVIFKVNVPATFTQPATFDQGLSLGGSSLASSGSAQFASLSTTDLQAQTAQVSNLTGQTLVTKTITASNILYGLKAGEGLTVGTGQTPTLTNTGVLSLGGATGSLKLVDGAGISVDGLTITNKDPGSAQNIFKTVKVAGQNDIAAGSNTDTLTFAAGGGISLTTDSGTKKLTFTSNDPSVAAGWTHAGSIINLTTDTDRVGIGTTNPSTKLHVLGDATITGGLSLAGGGLLNAGAITGGTGLTSSGQITFSSFSTGIVHSGSGGVLSSSAVGLASADVTGTLPTSNGGTGLTTYAIGDIPYAAATNTLGKLGVGADGQVLTVAGGVPTWATASGGSSGCADCVLTDPGSTQTITPGSATATGLVIKQASGGTADIFKVTDFAGTTSYFKVDAAGNVVLGSGQTTSGVLTVNPTGSDPIAISPAINGTPFTGTLTSEDLTQARTWTLPDQSGIICTTSGNCTGTSSSLGGSGAINYLAKWQGTYALANSLLYDDGTNVGIGATNPGYKIDVNGTGHISGATTLGSTLGVSGAATLSDILGVTGATTLSSTLNVTGATTLSSTLGVTSNTTIGGTFHVDNTGSHYLLGNVGIGTTNPTLGKLQITSGGQSTFLDTAGGSGISLGTTADMVVRSGADTYQDATNHFFRSQTGATEYMRINAAGNVGIGTTNPTAKLDIANTTDTPTVKVAATAATTNNVAEVTGNALTTGSLLNLNTTSNVLRSGTLLNLNQTATYNTPSIVANQNFLSVSRSLAFNNTDTDIQIGTPTTAGAENTNTLSYNHTVTAGNGRYLTVIVHTAGCANPDSVTYDGVPMSLLVSSPNYARCSQIYGLANPNVGTHNVVITQGGNWAGILSGATTFLNVNLSNPVSHTATGGPTLWDDPSLDIASSDNEVVVDAYQIWGSNAFPGAGQTSLWKQSDSYMTGAASYKRSTTTSTHMSWTGWGNYSSQAAISLSPSSTAPFSITGNLASFVSGCTETVGTCADSSQLIYINQQSANSTGSLISLLNAGTGADISFNTTPILRMADGGTMTWDDGANALMVLKDNGTTGMLGIGTTNPTATLDVKATGTGIIAQFSNDNNTSCTLAGDGSLSCSSDRTLKKNIVDLDYGLADVMKLNPVAFNWNFDPDSKTKSLGFIAQDVEGVIPGLVTINPTTGLRTLNTIGMVPVLAKAIQEQQLQIATLQGLSAQATQSATTSATLTDTPTDLPSLAAIVTDLKTKLQNVLTTLSDFKTEFFTKKSHQEQLCIGTAGDETCLTKDQVDAVLRSLPSPTPTSAPAGAPTTPAAPTPTEPAAASPTPAPVVSPSPVTPTPTAAPSPTL